MMSGDRPATAHKPAWNAGPDSATGQKPVINWTVRNKGKPRAARAAIAAADLTAAGHQQKRESQKDKRTRYRSPGPRALAFARKGLERGRGNCVTGQSPSPVRHSMRVYARSPDGRRTLFFGQ
jgi:hypothetical protein